MARWSAFFGGGSDNEEGRGLGGMGLLIMSILAPLRLCSSRWHFQVQGIQAGCHRAGFAGQPHGLANALEKLGAYSKRLPMHASPNTAHMFIVNPLRREI